MSVASIRKILAADKHNPRQHYLGLDIGGTFVKYGVVDEDAIRRARAAEEDKIREEKERIRAERRAANPDGITTNTSKKKLQQQQQKEQEAAKAAAAKEYAAKKGLLKEEDEADTAPNVMSGIPSRPYCKGRNFDPNRYTSQSTEE